MTVPLRSGRPPVWVVAALALLLIAGCSQAAPSTRTAAVPRAADQHLRVAVGDDVFLRRGAASSQLGLFADGPAPGIFETLTSLTPSFGTAPGLAVSWEARSPTEWRFELRRNVRFHDGTPLTAAAVVESLRRALSPDADTPGGGVRWLGAPRGLEADSSSAVDEHVVAIALSEPNLRLAEQLANPRTGVQAPGTRAGDGRTAATTPTGTGPFRFSSYTPGLDLEVVANPDYWDGPPQLASITFRFGAEEKASLLLATGEVEAVGHVSADLLANVTDGPDQRVVSRPARSAMLLFNRGGIGRWSTLQEDAVRRAVALTLDRAAVAEAAWSGVGEPEDSVIPPVVLGAADAAGPERRDVAAAEELLTGAGWLPGPGGIRIRKGDRLALDLLVRRDSDGLPVAAAAIREQLAAVGIATSMTADPADRFTPLQRVNAGSFDLFLDVRSQEDANPCALCRFFTVRPGGDLTVSGTVRAGAAADALYDQVHTAGSPETARRLAAEFIQVAVAEEVVALPLATLPNAWLVSPRLEQFEPSAVGGAQRWHGVFLSR
ncbi:MAG: ABC transporter substrate-binding protein [Mycobacteriales bacterium]